MTGLLETSILHNYNHNQSRPVWISCDCGCDQLQPVLHATGCRLTCNHCGQLAYSPHKAECTRLPKQDHDSMVIDINHHYSHHHHPGCQLGQHHAPPPPPPPPHLVQAEFYQCATFFIHPLFFFLVFLMTGHDSFNKMTHSMSMLMHHPHLCPFPFP